MSFKFDRPRSGLVKNSRLEFCDCFLCFQTYVSSFIVMLKRDFTDIFMRSNSLETLLQGFKNLNVQVLVKWFDQVE
jgi:hypothetical protein